MSRIVVKNLPKKITAEKLKEKFSEKGTITDVQLKYTKDGIFRQFAFIGYESDDQAADAIKYFHRTCIQTSRITVEACAALGSDAKPKSWSKYSVDSSKNRIKENERNDEEIVVDKTKKSKIDKIEEILGEHKNDPKFIEFMGLHAKGKSKSIWNNDLALPDKEEREVDAPKETVKQVSSEDTDKLDDSERDSGSEEENLAKNDDISDENYFKSLKQTKGVKQIKKNVNVAKPKKSADMIDLLTIKIREIPYKTKRQDILKFFKPTKPYSIRLPTTAHGFCYVGFKTESDFKKAMLKNKSFMKGKQVFLVDFTEKNKSSKNQLSEENNTKTPNSKWDKQVEQLKNEENISDSGRIFFRNLAYTVTEENVQQLFEKYGPVAEINVPIDSVTRQIKGFGTVTFVMPEHALKAFNEMDGIIFHGRLLHLIPGKSKDAVEEGSDEKSSFKNRKQDKLKQTAGSAHNWNTLFLGANTVADLLAKNFQTSKEMILNSATGGSSAATRLALGETGIVLEMKRFLEENDICLDSFDSTKSKRSKTVILAKNLPADTTQFEIQKIFSKFGPLNRIVLPPTGVSALIEFIEPIEARSAFRKLAYSKFKHLPLYLEWAPENTFRSPAAGPMKHIDERVKEAKEHKEEKSHEVMNPAVILDQSKNSKETVQETEVSDDVPPEEGTTIFLRNLNFKTREPTIREHFKDIGQIHIIQVAMRKDPSNPSIKNSLGYGFIQFKKKSITEHVLKTMQQSTIDGNIVELKRSDRMLQSQVQTTKKSAIAMKQTGTKILVRNIPFQAKQNEIEDIFKTFGQIKTVRLPKKMTSGQDSHRGFGFVDYHTESDAKNAFEALSQSTHLYGRRLVLEWAAADDGVEELRKRTADHFIQHSSRKFSRKGVFDTSTIEDIDENADGE